MVKVSEEGVCIASPPGEDPVVIDELSSLAEEVVSALAEDVESTFALLDDGVATLGDLDELK